MAHNPCTLLTGSLYGFSPLRDLLSPLGSRGRHPDDDPRIHHGRRNGADSSHRCGGDWRPCESSENHVLFNGHARAGDEVKVTVVAAIGAVCVDHTYGEFRESQWAGGVTWSAGDFGPHPSGAVLSIRVSTDGP